MSDFTWVPHYVLAQSAKYSTLISEGESGKERRRSKRTTPTVSFQLQFNRLTLSDADALWTFYNAKKGMGTAFTWTNPVQEGGVNVEYTVRFESDALTRSYFMQNRYQLNLGLVKV